jgi:hypothetical protein
VAAYERTWQARGLAESSQKNLHLALADFGGYLAREQIPVNMQCITPVHVHGYLIDLRDRRKLAAR